MRLGSGETSLAGGRVFESLARTHSAPFRLAVLETPAGFELNSDRAAGRVADFLSVRLQNYRPEVTVVAARRRGTPFSPDDPDITAPGCRPSSGAGSPHTPSGSWPAAAWSGHRASAGAPLVF
jgi:hypothetical protein